MTLVFYTFTINAKALQLCLIHAKEKPHMAEQTIKCPKCRRKYEAKAKHCVYCGAINPMFSKRAGGVRPDTSSLKDELETEELDPLDSDINDEESFGEYEDEDENDEIDTGDDDDDDDEDDDDMEEDDGEGDEEDNDDEEEDDEEDEEDEDDDEEDVDDEEDDEDDEDYDDDEDSEELEDLEDEGFTGSEKRSPIKWKDKEKKAERDPSEGYDENGHYNPDFDSYYADTRTLIENEIDSRLAGKEKLILKIIAGAVTVAGIIVYLVLTL